MDRQTYPPWRGNDSKASRGSNVYLPPLIVANRESIKALPRNSALRPFHKRLRGLFLRPVELSWGSHLKASFLYPCSNEGGVFQMTFDGSPFALKGLPTGANVAGCTLLLPIVVCVKRRTYLP